MIVDSIRTWNRRRIQRHRLSKPVQNTPHGFKFVGLPTMMSGDYEKVEQNAIRHLLPKVDVLVDAGAHYGFYICVAQSAGVPVIAFEPDRSNVGMIAKNIGANGWGQDVILIPAATGYERGCFDMHGGGSGGTLADGYSKAPKSQTQTVPVVRMDDVIHLGDRKALIIIDVEGFELNALRGAEGLINNPTKPIFMVEVFRDEITFESGGFREDYPKVFELMSAAGFQTYFFGEASLEKINVEDLVAQFNNKDPAMPSGNFLFVTDNDTALLEGLL